MFVHTSYRVEKVIVTGFLLVILAGALLLFFCNNFISGIPLSCVDALFMATSAVCVTGLATVSVATDLGLPSQIVLLVLAQIGGMGFMTGMMLITVAVGRRIGIKSRVFFMGGLGQEGVQGAVKLLMNVIKYTLSFEFIGAVILFVGFILNGDDLKTSLYYAVFHAVSAFCNAGFSPIVNGMEVFTHSFIIPGVVMSLIVLGGLGFPVFVECRNFVVERKKFSHYTKMVLFITSVLIVAGTLLILVSEWNKAFSDFSVGIKLWNALFASVTVRTAGFDTVSPGNFSSLGQALMIVLMIIGASPASTGGGIKTTTFGVLLIAVWNELLGRHNSVFMHRQISHSVERRALALTVVYITTFLTAAVVLSIMEDMSFWDVLFETVSAIGTVGITVGITTKFSVFGKMILIALMFWGRVGILSFFASVVSREKGPEIGYVETQIPIG